LKALPLPKCIDHHRVVDDQVDGHQRVDDLGVTCRLLGGAAHGRQIDDGRHAGEILHQHPAGR
jgi:predicted ABC-class ATPase